jgi:uncharacterized RDD family membrane protein YckC
VTAAGRQTDLGAGALLLAYSSILDSIESPDHAREPTGRSIRRRATLCLLVRFFVVQHLNRSLDALRRAYHRGEALDPDNDVYEQAVKQLDAFQKSLPPLRPRLVLLLVLTLVFFTSSALARIAPDIDPTGVFLLEQSTAASAPTIREAAVPLRKLTNAVLTVSPGELPGAFKSFGCASGADGKPTICSVRRSSATIVASLVLLGGTVWLITLPLLPSFAENRRLFAHEPLAPPVSGARAPSVYEREAVLFSRLGARQPRDFPVELLSHGSLLVLPFWLASVTVVWLIYVLGEYRVPGDVTTISLVLYFELLLLTITFVRLLFLFRKRRESELGFAPRADVGVRWVATWAGRQRRALAHLVDLSIVAVLIASLVLPLEHVVQGNEVRILAVSFLVPVFASSLYELLLLILAKPSLGKALFGIRVVTRFGARPSVPRVLFRNVGLKGFLVGPWFVLLFLLLPSVDFDSSYDYVLDGLQMALAAPLFVVVVDHAFALRRRSAALHDLIAGTAVVEKDAGARPT